MKLKENKTILDYGTISPSPDDTLSNRLLTIYQDIITIIDNFTGKKNKLGDIKQILIKEYEKIEEKKIKHLFACQGKRSLAILLEKGVDIQTIILSDNYYISNIDILMLANHFAFPFVFISGISLLENYKSDNPTKTIASYLQDNSVFYYIILHYILYIILSINYI